MRRWVIVAVGAAAVLGGVMGGTLVRVIDQRSEGLEALIRVRGIEAAMLRTRVDELEAAAGDGMTEKVIDLFGDHAGQLSDHESRLGRIDSLLEIAGIDRVRGWWCGHLRCGRTRRECADHEKRTLMLDGPQLDGTDCRPVRLAWCPAGSSIACSTSKCSGCIATE